MMVMSRISLFDQTDAGRVGKEEENVGEENRNCPTGWKTSEVSHSDKFIE